jgi:hypothetical protein
MRALRPVLFALGSLIVVAAVSSASAAPVGTLAPETTKGQRLSTDTVQYYRYHQPYYWNHHRWQHRYWRHYRWHYYN